MSPPVTVKAALLQALRHGPTFGLDLAVRVGDLTGGKVCISIGGLYPALVSLEAEGLIKHTRLEATPSGGKPRQYYALTPKGEAKARENLAVVRALFG